VNIIHGNMCSLCLKAPAIFYDAAIANIGKRTLNQYALTKMRMPGIAMDTFLLFL
jgi:hypothetical protein